MSSGTIKFESLEFLLQNHFIKYLHAIYSDSHTTLVNLVKELIWIDRMTERLQSLVHLYFCRNAHIVGIKAPPISVMN